MTGVKRSIGTTPLWLIGLLGMSITTLGVYIQATGTSQPSKMIAGTLTALGGGVIGATISIYFSAGEGRDTLSAVRQLIGNSLRARMRSDEAVLAGIRRPWHYYHLTERDGAYVWRHTHYALDKSNAAGSIEQVIKDVSFGRDHHYRAEMAVRGDRLILVESPENGSEPPIVAVVPFFTEGYRKVRAGIALMRSWDGHDMVTKCIWSPRPLAKVNEFDVVSDHDVTDLEELWDQAFKSQTVILPSARRAGDASPSPTEVGQ